MKKYIFLILLVIIALTSIGYLYISYTSNQKEVQANNKIYENLYNKEITGTDFATIINKTIDNNEKNQVEKEENGYFIDNGKNSVIVEIKFKDSDEIFKQNFEATLKDVETAAVKDEHNLHPTSRRAKHYNEDIEQHEKKGIRKDASTVLQNLYAHLTKHLR